MEILVILHKKDNINIFLLIYLVVLVFFTIKSTAVSDEFIIQNDIKNSTVNNNVSETSGDFDISNRTTDSTLIKRRNTDNASIDGMDWSDQNNTRFGKIFNTTFYTLPQLPGFNTSEVSSGPIVLFDEKTIFIANLNFSGTNKKAHFWGGKGTSMENGVLIPDERNSLEPLKKYIGGNQILLTLPQNWTVNDTDYFGIWSNSSKTDFGYVSFSEIDKSSIRDHQSNEKEPTKKPFLFPKCCPLGTKIEGGCTESEEETVLDVTIYDSNETHIDPDVTLSTSTLDIQTYVYVPTCKPGQNILEVLESETHGMIYNMSLIVNGAIAKNIYPHGTFCIDQVKDQAQTITLICRAPENTISAMPDLYLPLLIISMICFGICAICYALVLTETTATHGQHRISFVVYSSAMFVTFLTLMILQTTSNYIGCLVVGSIFVAATMVSFTWLSILTFDLVCMIKNFKGKKTNDRLFWYAATSIGISFVVLILSLFVNQPSRPNIPNSFIKRYSQTHCEYADSNISMFFVPIGVLILISFGCLIMSFHYIRNYEKAHRNEHDWLSNRNKYKFLLRSYMIIVTLAAFWLAEAIFTFYSMQEITKLAFDLIEASLGVVTVIIFILNRYSRKEIMKKLPFKKQKSRIQELEMELNGYRTPATPATPTDESRKPRFPEVYRSELEIDGIALVNDQNRQC